LNGGAEALGVSFLRFHYRTLFTAPPGNFAWPTPFGPLQVRSMTRARFRPIYG